MRKKKICTAICSFVLLQNTWNIKKPLHLQKYLWVFSCLVVVFFLYYLNTPQWDDSARSGPQLFRFETPALWFFVRLRNHGLGFCVALALIASFQKWFVFLERSNPHDSSSDTIDWPLSGIIDWPLSGMQAVVVYLYADHSVLYVSILTLQFTAKDSSTCFWIFEFRFLLTLI